MSTPLSRMRPAGGTALGTAARRLFEGVVAEGVRAELAGRLP